MKGANEDRSKLVWILSLICGSVFLGGCPGASLVASLPADLDPSLRYVFDNKDLFREAGDGGHAETGVVVDWLSELAGCWGSFAADVAEGEESVGVDDYASVRFDTAGVLTTWNLEDTGGLFATVFSGHGRYEIVADNRIQFIIDRRDYYNPFSKQYETLKADPPEVTEYLATLDGKTLLLLMLDQPGDAPPEPGSPDYTMVYRQFACAD